MQEQYAMGTDVKRSVSFIAPMYLHFLNFLRSSVMRRAGASANRIVEILFQIFEMLKL